MYVCVCVCMSVWMHIKHVCMYVCLCVYTCTFIYTCMYVYMQVHMNLFMCLHSLCLPRITPQFKTWLEKSQLLCDSLNRDDAPVMCM